MKHSALTLTGTLLLAGLALPTKPLGATPDSCGLNHGYGCCAPQPAPAGKSCPHAMTDTTQPIQGAVKWTAWVEPFSLEAEEVLRSYLFIQKRLAADELEDVSAHAGIIVASALRDPELPPQVAKTAQKLRAATDLGSARQSFMALSAPLIAYTTAHQAPMNFMEVYCGMAKAAWLQQGTAVRNPYYGGSMLECGTIKRTLTSKRDS